MNFIFDLDGTLCDTEFEVSKITATLANEKGCAISAEDVHLRFAGLRSREKFAAIAADRHVKLSDDDLTYLADEHERLKGLIYSRDEVPVIDGVPETLAVIENAGIKMSVASSNPSDVSRRGLSKSGLSKHFNGRVYGSDHVNDRKKPDPAVFHYAMANDNMAPDDTIIVEDSLSGIKAGHLSGAFVVALMDARFKGRIAQQKAKEMKAAGANAVIRSFDQLKKFLPGAING